MTMLSETMTPQESLEGTKDVVEGESEIVKSKKSKSTGIHAY
jgi:hypothetical protein